MRMAKMIILKRNTVIFYQILLTYSFREFMEISLENLLVDIGASMVSDGGRLKEVRLYLGFSFIFRVKYCT